MKTISDLPMSQFLINKQFRLYNAIRSRINALEFQYQYYLKHYNANLASDLTAFRNDLEILNGLLNRLVINSLFCNKTYLGVLQEFVSFPKTIKEHSEKLLGFYVPRKLNLEKNLNILKDNYKSAPSDLTKEMILQEENNVLLSSKFLSSLKHKCLQARKSELKARLSLECNLRVRDGWLVVFNTLTVDNHNHEEVFGESSTAWTDYVRSVDRAIGIRLFGSWRAAVEVRKGRSDLSSTKDTEFHTYFAVVERGSSTGRLHIHVLHFMKGLPNGCSDPNIGRNVPNYREIAAFKKFWKFGYSSPKAVRFDMSDAFSKLFWRWPVELVDGKWVSIKCSEPDALVGYIAKYMTKEFDKAINQEETKWRTKCSQKLGQTIPQMIVSRCTMLQLETILRMRSRNTLQVKNKNLPLWMMKKLAMSRILKLSLKRTPKSCWNMLMALKPRASIMKLLKSMIQKKENLSTPSFGDLRVLQLLNMVGFSLLELVKKISDREFGLYDNSYFKCGFSMEVRCG